LQVRLGFVEVSLATFWYDVSDNSFRMNIMKPL